MSKSGAEFIKRQEAGWCPQHGYPLPCDKCVQEQSVLEGCEVVCLGQKNPNCDLITCPLSPVDTANCWERKQFEAGRLSMAKELFNEMICPMCYRLNPQHETMDNGKGCKTCQEKEEWLGEK